MVKRSSAGFTMVELMITIAILFIGILPVFSLYSEVGKLSRVEKQKAVAVQLATERLEKVKKIMIDEKVLFTDSQKWYHLLYQTMPDETVITSWEEFLIGNFNETKTDASAGNYLVELNISNIETDPDSQHENIVASEWVYLNQLNKLTVTVRWPAATKEHAVELATYVTPR
ncbi:type IV pilus modification PilV family protein [Heliophilum fasciatum]|uniref:Prepilin-type N-terminal cleavage/methylation domain-containing protein n=1 Tax=Heliophilum fasciatum TaxID=35700 RepID=A0A4R2S451_9FIRM|nr:prepilin-type N-terminal cleavage/methylation domain-containing protein [Heliophilum fasciatum]MCW2277284.1 prepilin-type N-terminal cleavage/methylation domain-containing protein [Heliophilum fasciatum]TCP67121.1 prepilin-type N-terminal cleavage/methylation domain-containing protein [Heliophilum fasciatum]